MRSNDSQPQDGEALNGDFAKCGPVFHRVLRIPHVYPNEFLPKGGGGLVVDEAHGMDGVKTFIVDTETYEKIKAEGRHVCK